MLYLSGRCLIRARRITLDLNAPDEARVELQYMDRTVGDD